ncbi:MAG: c-type cytochrome [Rhodothermales bacterium]
MRVPFRPAAYLAALVFAFSPHSLMAQPVAGALPPGVTMAMVEQGGALFQGRGLCANCHGEGATGVLGPDLTDADWLQAKGSYLSILQVILTGVPESESTRQLAMPPRGGGAIDDVDVQAVAAFVWRISHPGEPLPAGVSAAMIDRGNGVFHGPGQCVSCHGDDASGARGPNLTDGEWLHAKGSYLEIVRTIEAGVPIERATRGIPMPPRGGSNLSPDEVHAVAAYVWYVSHRARP